MLTREPTRTEEPDASCARWRADSGGAGGPKNRRQNGPALNKDDCSRVFEEPKNLLKMLGLIFSLA
jgi:hypothetical protein